MPRFSSPSGRPFTIGDRYLLYRQSEQPPAVPIVEDTDTSTPKEDGKVEENDPKEGDRKGDREETDEPPSKKVRLEKEEGADDSKGDGAPSEDVDAAKPSEGSKTPAVHGKDAGVKPEAGEEGTDKPVVGEQSPPKQEAEEVSSGVKV